MLFIVFSNSKLFDSVFLGLFVSILKIIKHLIILIIYLLTLYKVITKYFSILQEMKRLVNFQHYMADFSWTIHGNFLNFETWQLIALRNCVFKITMTLQNVSIGIGLHKHDLLKHGHSKNTKQRFNSTRVLRPLVFFSIWLFFVFLLILLVSTVKRPDRRTNHRQRTKVNSNS